MWLRQNYKNNWKVKQLTKNIINIWRKYRIKISTKTGECISQHNTLEIKYKSTKICISTKKNYNNISLTSDKFNWQFSKLVLWNPMYIWKRTAVHFFNEMYDGFYFMVPLPNCTLICIFLWRTTSVSNYIVYLHIFKHSDTELNTFKKQQYS